MARNPASSPKIPRPRSPSRSRVPSARTRQNQDAEVDGLGEEEPRRATRRMSPGDRQQAELAAALRAKLTGAPLFPFPPELNDEHKPYWTEVVNSKPHDYFNLGDIHLLKLYCRVAADIDRLDREIASEGSVILNTRDNVVVNPRILVRSIAETRLLTLSSKLRMQPSSRYDSEQDRNQSTKKRRADAAVRAMGDDDGDDDGLIARGRLN